MKRTPLKRGTKPLKRKTRLRARGNTTYQRRPRKPAYMAWVRRQPCCARHLSPCIGRIDPDHAGRKEAAFRKVSDRTCIPMCRRHHRERDEFSGAFRGWLRDEMRRWLDAKIAEVHAAYEIAQRKDAARRPRSSRTRR